MRGMKIFEWKEDKQNETIETRKEDRNGLHKLLVSRKHQQEALDREKRDRA
jgi:hypothetical protein